MRSPPTSGRVVTFGHIMLRLSASDGTRLEDAGTFTATMDGTVAVPVVSGDDSALAIAAVVAATDGGAAARMAVTP